MRAVLTDLSKGFDFLNHKLLIAKLESYGFEHNAVAYIYLYLLRRNQMIKIKSTYSSWREIKSDLLQGSILGPILFNMFVNNIFLFVEKSKIATYADDNTPPTPYAIASSIEKLIATIECDISILLN